ncbi:hypothetical protein V6N11_051070 [Hibiscus sabdariffa]|uniref:Uncharacterized protein n=1 Tax=Hibiscus sabdariffa TaxID=183260 RepID=A0ABR2R2S8_9ROSI
MMYLRNPLFRCWTGLCSDWAASDGSASRGLSSSWLRFTDLDGGTPGRGLELSRWGYLGGLCPDWAASNGSASRDLSASGLRFTDLDGGTPGRGLELSQWCYLDRFRLSRPRIGPVRQELNML